MVAYCHLEVKETTAQLQKILNQQRTSKSYRKVQALYLLKTGQIKTVKEIAKALGVHRVSVQRWFKQYADEGIKSLVVVKEKTGRPQIISSKAVRGLRERLKDPKNGFKSYGEIRDWLYSEYGEAIEYKTLHGLVRYKLKAKLKVPRKTSVKKDPEQAENFKKN